MQVNRRSVLQGVGAVAAVMVAPAWKGYTVQVTTGNTLVLPEIVAREALRMLRNNLALGLRCGT